MPAHRFAARASATLFFGAYLWVAAAAAQTGSERADTGRQRADTGRLATPPSSDAESTRWMFTLGAGVMASGDLFKVRVPSGIDVTWQAPSGSSFNSDRFTVTVDEDLQIGAAAAWRAARRLWLRGDFSWARVQATALAIIGQTGEIVPYDEFEIFLGGLVAEYRLVPGRTFPFLTAGGAWMVLHSVGTGGLDQSRAGWRFGGGIQHDLGGRWGLRAEIRDTVVDLDCSGYRPRAVVVPDPNVEFEVLKPQHLWEITASLTIRIGTSEK